MCVCVCARARAGWGVGCTYTHTAHQRKVLESSVRVDDTAQNICAPSRWMPLAAISRRTPWCITHNTRPSCYSSKLEGFYKGGLAVFTFGKECLSITVIAAIASYVDDPETIKSKNNQ